jgi:opacity protein-like surface antigen
MKQNIGKPRYPDLAVARSMALSVGVLACASSVIAQDMRTDSGWYGRAWGGFSALPDTSGTVEDFAPAAMMDSVDVSTDGGFAAGAAVGYRYGPSIGVEVAWEYRTNDSDTTFASGPRFSDGNYASNTFFLNGTYYFNGRGAWEPYIGAGLAWIQEVDIDFEGVGPEQSFSGDGDVGIQVFVGTNYRLSERWSAQGELRYGRIGGIDLEGENVSGSISGFDYEPFTAQLGLRYHF